jgi:hypothetical protein
LDSFWEVKNYETLIEAGMMAGQPVPAYSLLAYSILHINTTSHFDRVFSTVPPVYYNYVTEWVSSGNTGPQLKTEYTYSHTRPYSDCFIYENGDYYIRSYDNLFSKGPDLINKVTYKTNSNNTYSPVESIAYQYTELSDNIIQNLYTTRRRNNTSGPDFATPGGFADYQYQGIIGNLPGGEFYNCYETFIRPASSGLKGEIRTLYTDNGEVTDSIKYTRRNNTLLLKKEVTGGNRSQVTEEYEYRTYNNRLYAYPTLTKKTQDGSSENKQIQYYHDKIGQINTIGSYKNQNPVETRATYHNYNNYGKPVYITLDDATKLVYLWSYSGQYPIAEIKNATFAEVEAAAKTVFSVAGIDALSTLTTPNEDKLNYFRLKAERFAIG